MDFIIDIERKDKQEMGVYTEYPGKDAPVCSLNETRLIVCGDEKLTDYGYFSDRMDMLSDIYEDMSIVSGHDKGTDTLAERYAKERGIPIHIFSTEWDRFGIDAVPIRNKTLLEYDMEAGSRCIAAFWNGKNCGTGDMLRQAFSKALRGHVFPYTDGEECTGPFVRKGKITRIIVSGGRDFADYQRLESVLDDVTEGRTDVEIVSGHAKGADLLGERYAREHGIMYTVFPADWKQFPIRAGFIRNREMLDYATDKEAMLISFRDGKSHGTKDMIELAKEACVPVKIYHY